MKPLLPRAALLLLIGAVSVTVPIRAQAPQATTPSSDVIPDIAPAKRVLIERLLELTGSANLGRQMMDSVLASLKPTIPDVPEEFWQSFEKEIDMNELVRRIVPIYDRHLSEEDLRALVAFYESPLGKKLISQLPGIMRESMEAGQSWGTEMAQRAMQRVQEEKAKKGKEKKGAA